MYKIKYLAAFLLTLFSPHVSYGDPCSMPGDAGRFLRIQRNQNGEPISLDASVITYASQYPMSADVQVDLISAVHVGEQGYFDELNQTFQGYDALLYELIKPTDVDMSAPREESSDSVLSFLQNGLKRVLKLEFQLDKIDYSKKNFVHADMSPDQFMKSMKDRGESFFSMMLKILLRSSELEKKNPSLAPEVMLMQLLLDPHQKNALRRIIAEQFQNVEIITEVINGKEGSTIISERNKVALDVLARELKAGKKRLGIYYGAGHMPDMETRLLKDFSLACKEVRWVKAWDLSSG